MRKIHSGISLWEKTAPPAPNTAALTTDIRADVVVVGGGFTGVSTALNLAKNGARVVLLEAGKLGSGGSGRNFGLVNAGSWVMPDHITSELGQDRGGALLKFLGDAPKRVFDLIETHQIDCEADQIGTLHCAVGKAGLQELQERAAQWAKHGAKLKLLSAQETRLKTGTELYSGSLLDMRAGTIQPLAYLHGLAKAAIAAGATIYCDSPVLEQQPEQYGYKIRTAQGTVHADWVVVATNAYSSHPWSSVRKELVQLPFFSFVTAPLDKKMRASILPARHGITDTQKILNAYRYDREGRLIFGSVGSLANKGARFHEAWAKRSLQKLFPQLDNIDFETKWCGRIGMTDNHLPRFHKFARNVIGMSGYNGRGIAAGTVFGEKMAEHILGRLKEEDLPLPLTTIKEQRLRSIQELGINLGSQLMHIVGARR